MLNFPLILTAATLFAGIIVFIDFLYRRAKKADAVSSKPHSPTSMSVILEYSRSLFPILLIVLLLRSFVIQNYNVPTGSLLPTVVPGDFILVNQFKYGVKLPIWNRTLIPVSTPKKGQIALFYWPVNKKFTFVKRVIGVPGDRISYINKVLFINGKRIPQTLVGHTTQTDGEYQWKVDILSETINGVTHKIYVCAKDASFCPTTPQNFYNLIVPKGHYFMMGDNRDDSDDSRDWGFVPVRNYIGEAFMVWFSWNASADWKHKIRWHRIGTSI